MDVTKLKEIRDYFIHELERIYGEHGEEYVWMNMRDTYNWITEKIKYLDSVIHEHENNCHKKEE